MSLSDPSPPQPNSRSSVILRAYYPCVHDLYTYLKGSLELSLRTEPEPAVVALCADNDSKAYVDLLKTSYVATKEDKRKTFRYYHPMLDMREIIDQAQGRLFKNKRPQNIITSGYRLASHAGNHGRAGMARIGITNYFINTIITAFHAPEWEILLHRIGEDAMLHLLTETSIFTSLPNGCLCQISGEPMIYMMPRAVDTTEHSKLSRQKRVRSLIGDDDEDRPKKRQRLNKSRTAKLGKLNDVGTIRPPADISFARVRLFYSKPNFIPHSDHIIVGLPLRHVFNRLYPSYQQKNAMEVEDERKKAENARHISKYIFARQYGLNTPFSSTATKGSYSLGDYLDRELEIKGAGSVKTPKRLKQVLPLLEKLLRRHCRCGYIPLRDGACPSKISKKNVDSSIILELMSETSVQLRSQTSLGAGNISLDSDGNPIPAIGLTQARKHAKDKPRFIEFACSHIEVYRYVALVTKAIIPKSFWGSKANLELVLRYVKQFIRCRRYETLTLHIILQKFSTSACDWLAPSSAGAQQQHRVSVSDALKRRELLEDFLFWYFDSFVLPLLKTTFYITESSAFRNQVLYFRHDNWATLCAPLIRRLTSVTFEKLSDADAAEILRQRRLGFSFVRLLPKETGVRPIVNLRRMRTVNRGSFTTEQSINQVLQAAFSILTYERTNQPQLLGASMLGPDDIYRKLKKFKAALPRDINGALPQLYFVKVDVQACFDTIDQTKLLQILRQLLSEDVYMMQKYGQISVMLDKTRRTYVKKAVPEDDHPHFLRHAANLASVLRNTIFVDQVVYPLSKKQEVLELLEEHITENIVKIGSNYYRQTVGIPQGSVLSSILCSFFYGDLEKKFPKFMDDPHSVLLRVIDDYLFITTSHNLATEFLDMMNKGHPEYGCFISQEKTLTNFDYCDQVQCTVAPNQRTFPWCGYCINTRDLSVTVDYNRYLGSGISNTMTIDRGRRPGVAFNYKMLLLAKAKSHVIFSDRELNTEHVVYLNIYQNLLLTAVKMHEYLRNWGVSGKRNIAFLRNVIERTIIYNYTTTRGQARRKGAPKVQGGSDIHKEAVVWLGNHAFYHILSRKPYHYKPLLIWLQFELRRLKSRLYHRRFKALVKEAQAVFLKITGAGLKNYGSIASRG